MIFRGRHIDPVSLWEQFVEFPPEVDTDDEFGPKVVCPNPEHDTLKRHFQVNLKYPMVHCFANCGISGSYQHAIQLITGCNRREARRTILEYSRIPTPGDRKSVAKRKTQSRQGVESVPTLPQLADFSYVPPKAREYLHDRGIKDRSIARFQLGYDLAERRITIPVFDQGGKLRMVISRAIREKDYPKYLYTEGVDKKRLLYGVDKIDPGMVRSWGLVLVEGALGLIRLDQFGVAPVIAIMGSSLHEIQAETIRRLRPRRIFTLFDKDLSGIAAIRSVEFHFRSTPISVCLYPKGVNDIDDFTRREAHRVIERSIPIVVFNARVSRRMKGVSPWLS